MARDKDNRHLTGLAGLAYQSRSLETAQTREAAVHQDQVRARSLNSADGLLTIGGFDHAVISHLQHGAEQETRVGVVVGDKNERPRTRRPRICYLLEVAHEVALTCENAFLITGGGGLLGRLKRE
jgi:hypothetical protein